MRTTVRLDDSLLADAKRLAAEEGRTLTSLIEDGLRYELGRRSGGPRRPVRITTFKGNGFAPGMTQEHLLSNEKMLDLLDGLD